MSHLYRALQLAAGTLSALVRIRRIHAVEVVRFTGDFEHLGCPTVGEVLDATNTALGCHSDVIGALQAARAFVAAEIEARGDEDEAYPAEQQAAPVLSTIDIALAKAGA